MPGGERRLANVRKLMRLGREYEAASGRDLRGFLELVRARAAGWGGAGDSRESEAPVESEALDAVRLMTIHRAKGLEFGTVCVADLGRGPIRRAPLVRIGRDGGFGIRLAEPGTGRKENALDYQALGEKQQRFEEAEERRLFYVAMTRARDRLILSGAAKLEEWPVNVGGGPIGWIAPAFVGETDERVGVTFVRPEDDVEGEGSAGAQGLSLSVGGTSPAAPPPAA
jgi:ATP-dependent helicase/nuclease subunit A